MSEAVSVRRQEWSAAPAVLAGLAGAFALAVGVAAGDPGSGMLVPVAITTGLLAVVGVLIWPFAGMLVLAFSVFFMVIVPVVAINRYANPFDIVLLPLVLVSLLGRARRAARARDALEAGPQHEELRVAARRFSRSALLYFVVAALSLLPMALHLGLARAFMSGLSLLRAAEGALLFPLALLWLRNGRRVDTVIQVVFAAVFLLFLVNSVYVFGLGMRRAGIEWSVGPAAEAVAGPNEAAAGLLVVWALLQARRRVAPHLFQLVLMGLVLVLLFLTQSRSGLMAFATFLLLSVRRVHWRWILQSSVVLLVALPAMPVEYWDRLGKSLALKEGSFELFTLLVRVFGYGTAWRVFLDHWLTGVGYLGFRFVSSSYNEFRLVLGQVENFPLETLVGMGLVGVIVVVFVFQRLYLLGRVARRSTRPGTLGHELARVHAPLLTALLVANLTGATFVGMVGVGQVALWCALLVRAGHLAVPGEEAA